MRRAAIVLALIAAIALVTSVLALVGWPARAYRESDWMQYYTGSSAILQGASPWDLAWWRAFHAAAGSLAPTGPPHTGDPASDWTTPYPLWTFVMLLPFALAPLSVAAPLFAVTQVAAVLSAAWLFARTVVAARAVPLALALVACAQPLWSLIAGGNVTGFAAAAFTVALWAALRGRPGLAGLALAGTLLKPHLFVIGSIALVAAAPPSARPRLIGFAALGALALILPSFALQPGWVGPWLTAVTHLQTTSLSNATGWTIARPFTSDFVPWSAAVVGASLLAFALWWYRARPSALALVAAALPISVLVAPHGWTYDYIVLVPTAVVAVAIASAAHRRVAALVAAVVLVSILPWVLNVVAFARNGEELSAFVLIVAALAAFAFPRVAPHAGPGVATD